MKLHFIKLNRVFKNKTIVMVLRSCKIWLKNTPCPEKMELCMWTVNPQATILVT